MNIIDSVASLCYADLSDEHVEYMVGRGILHDVLDEFEVGTFDAKHISAACRRPELEKLGILHSKWSKKKSMFDGRIVFPVRDVYGEAVALVGRAFADDASVKYYNSVFTKSSHLFYLNKSAPYILESGYAIVVEGNLDVMSLVSCGIRNCVGTNGTSFSDTQLRLLMRYASTLLIAMDNDKAGNEAYNRINGVCMPYVEVGDISMCKVFLPSSCKDVNDVLRKLGREECFRLFSAYMVQADPPGAQPSLLWG